MQRPPDPPVDSEVSGHITPAGGPNPPRIPMSGLGNRFGKRTPETSPMMGASPVIPGGNQQNKQNNQQMRNQQNHHGNAHDSPPLHDHANNRIQASPADTILHGSPPNSGSGNQNYYNNGGSDLTGTLTDDFPLELGDMNGMLGGASLQVEGGHNYANQSRNLASPSDLASPQSMYGFSSRLKSIREADGTRI
jgi:hypothetical protein